MEILSLWVLLLASIFGIFSYVLLIVLLKTVNRLAEVNKQLLIIVAGKETKPETLRALIASNKPPQGKLRGIADKKKKNDEPTNKNYTMEIGVR